MLLFICFVVCLFSILLNICQHLGCAYSHQIYQLLFLAPYLWVVVFSVLEHLLCPSHARHMPSHSEVSFYLSLKSILEKKIIIFNWTQNKRLSLPLNFKIDLGQPLSHKT